jgi:uncharacterized protein YihD (DUF1040 family)
MFMILFPLIVTLVATAGYIAYNWSDYKPQFQNIYAKLTHGKSIASVGSGGGLSFTKKKDVARSAMMDIIAIMQSMDKSEPEIIAKLESEGYSRAMVEGLIEELKVVQAKVSNIKREDTVLGIIKGLDSEIDVVTKVLKAKGYTENEIREALAELSMDTSAKEKKLRSDAGISSEEKIT